MLWSTYKIIQAISAFATAGMALTAGGVIWQNKKHHQDNFIPILLFKQNPENMVTVICEMIDPIENKECMVKFKCRVCGVLRNAGRGPALDVRLTLRHNNINGRSCGMNLGPLGSGDDIDTSNFLLFIAPGMSPDSGDFKNQNDWWIIIEYEDMFKTKFYTQHILDDAHLLQTEIGRGRAKNGRDPELATTVIEMIQKELVATAARSSRPMVDP